ncbi:MAG: peptidoglycan DD-metalloendopeptidase family protein, partial [Firmicutes bacterium]|nr:peptidoglycan DD-metalloendopeptidase family protein [Bacillota bacterium]
MKERVRVLKREQRKKTAERKRFSVVLALCLCLTMIAMSAIDLNVFAAGNGEQVTPALQGELTEGGQEGAGDPGSEPADNTGGDPAGDTNGGEGTSGAETDPEDPPTDPQGEPGTGEDPADPGSQGEGETPAGEQGETEDPGKQDPGTGEDPGKTEDPGQNDPEETEDPGTETEDPGTETEDPQSGEEESGKEETEDPGEETPEDPEEETPVEELPEDVQEEKKAEEEAEAEETEAQAEAEAQKQEAEEEAAAEQEKIEAARKEAEEQEALAAAEAEEAARRAREIEEATQRAREEAAAGEDEDEEFSTQDPFNYIEKYYVPDVIGHYAYPLTSEAYISYYFGSHDELHHNGHDGVDLAIAMGTPVLAAEKGVVVEAHQWLGTVGDGYGNYILIKHPDGNMTRYAHLSEINVKAGQQVVRGQQIGRVGSTGRSTGPHLHFEVITPNGLTDPLPFINAHDWNIGVGIKGTGGSIHIRNSEGLETAIHRSAAGKLCYTEALGGTEVAPGAKYHIINERPDQEVSFKVYYAPGYRVSAVRKTKDGKQYPVTFTGGNGVLSFKLPSQDDETVLEVTFIAVGSTAREAVLV